MQNPMKLLMCGLMGLAISITSCSKDSDIGPIGPQGPQGEQGSAGAEGAQGPAGQDGEALGVPGPKGDTGATGQVGATGADGTDGSNGTNGTDGEDGNANVMVSDWIPTAFSQTPAFDVGFSVTDPNLTKEIINNSLILGYGKRNSAFIDILPLPTQIFNQLYRITLSDAGGENYDLFFRGKSADGSTETFNLLSEVKYFVIPANSTTGKSRSDYEKMSYDEIVAHFGLDY